MKTTMKMAMLAGLGIGLAGCSHSSGKGSLRGQMLDSSGQPVKNARVMLDTVHGKTVTTDIHGKFLLTGTTAGAHKVIAYQAIAHDWARFNANVSGGQVEDVGQVQMSSCSEDPSDGSDPNDPCTCEPPPPPPDSVTFDHLEATDANATIDANGIYGDADDENDSVAWGFSFAGDFTQGGSTSASVAVDNSDPNNPVGDASMSLYVYDASGYAYELRTGDLSIELSDDGDGDPYTSGFHFVGDNLTFDFIGWDGNLDSTHTATVTEAVADGGAESFEAAPAPTADVNIDPFIADERDITLCQACAADGGDLLWIEASSEADHASISLTVPVSSLALGGDVVLTVGTNGDLSGQVTVTQSGDHSYGEWYYSLNTATFSVSSSAVTPDQNLHITITAAQFDYAGMYDAAGVSSELPVDPSLKLNIGTADLSADVHLYVQETDPGCTCGS